jgi:hypothetical protein
MFESPFESPQGMQQENPQEIPQKIPIAPIEKTSSSEQVDPRLEKRGMDLQFYVTDHSPDAVETGNTEGLEALYADIKKDGVTSVRYDWRWNKVEAQRDQFDQVAIDRYVNAVEVMKKVGLESPTVVFSSIPDWALDLYKKDKQAFFKEYRIYIERMREGFIQAKEKTGDIISRVQVLNELNNDVYTPVAPEDISHLCDITREVFFSYNPEIKLLGTLFVGNLPELLSKATLGMVKLGTPVAEYLENNKDMLNKFDVLALDYYPGMWHVDFQSKRENGKEMFKQIGLLKETMETVAGWGKEYELGEVGIQTNMPLLSAPHNEDRQRYFFDVFFREFKHLLNDFQQKGIALPKAVGLYQAQDESPKNLMGKLLRKFTPFPEHDMGMRKDSGNRKEILKGNRHVLTDEERAKSPSQLSKIISYMKAPMEGRGQ